MECKVFLQIEMKMFYSTLSCLQNLLKNLSVILDCDNKGEKYNHRVAKYTLQIIALKETKRKNSILVALHFSGAYTEQVLGKWLIKLKYFLCWIFSEFFCSEALVSEKYMVTV